MHSEPIGKKQDSMNVIYFDRNVFDNICTLSCGVTKEDVAKIQRAVESGKITIPASYTVIEETVPIIRASEEKYEQHIQTVLNLVDKDRIIKPHNQLIREDCLSYAFGQPLSPRMEATSTHFRRVLNLSINRDDLKALTEEIHEFYTRLAAKSQVQFDDLLDEMKQMGLRGYDNFQDAWEALSLVIVEGVVSRLPRTPKRLCRKRGIKRMLNIKSIRIGTIYYCWFYYSHWLKTDGKPGKVQESEAGDFFHAICASAADIFVTQESKNKYGKLPFILSQVPIPKFTVMGLKEFVATL
jgi:hypothetical protein